MKYKVKNIREYWVTVYDFWVIVHKAELFEVAVHSLHKNVHFTYLPQCKNVLLLYGLG